MDAAGEPNLRDPAKLRGVDLLAGADLGQRRGTDRGRRTCSAWSVLVVVVVVGGVVVPVVHVVDVIGVRYRDVPAALTVGVLMAVVGGVPVGFALVEVTVVGAVEVPVVHIVNVANVGDGDMAASLAVDMDMPRMFRVGGGHRCAPSWRSWSGVRRSEYGQPSSDTSGHQDRNISTCA
jgi:hypothetical protein